MVSLVSRWTKEQVVKWVKEIHGGDYSEHVPKFLKMDGMRLLSLSRDDLKEIVGPVDGIVMYKCVCAACPSAVNATPAATIRMAINGSVANAPEVTTPNRNRWSPLEDKSEPTGF
jgi:hypothetical protein